MAEQHTASGLIGLIGRRSAALLLAGVLCINMACFSLWSWRTFASSQGFADVVTDMLKEPTVRQVIATQIVSALEQQGVTARAVVNARPILEQAVGEIVATDAFRGIFHAGAQELHSAVIQGQRSRMLVRVDDAAPLVKDALRLVNPTLADAIPDSALQVVVGVSQSTGVDNAIRVSELAGWAAAPFAGLAVNCFVLAARRSPDRRRVVELIGLSLICLGLLWFAVLALGVNLITSLGHDPQQRTALRAVFWSTMHLVNVQGKLAMTIGAVVVLAAVASGPGGAIRQLRRAGASIGTALARPRTKAEACVVLMAAGAFALAWPAAAAAIVIRVMAGAALTIGAIGLLDLVGSSRWTLIETSAFRDTGRRIAIVGTSALTGVGSLLAFGGFAFFHAVRAPHARHVSISATGCNGHIELCDRRLDEVTFAATHNGMSASANHGWLFTRHTGGVAAQLSTGVRAFLLDLHYGSRTQQLVRTDFGTDADRLLSQAQVSTAQVAAIDRVLAIIGAHPRKSERDVWLCHLYCELGATRALDTFRLINDFLLENPNEVVILVLEDHVSPEDATRTLRQSGLGKRALVWTDGQALPTLRQMIESGHNLLVLAEHGGGKTPWYLPAYASVLQDTPYNFATQDQFTCELDRGDSRNPMLLVNHWLNINPPSPAAAVNVNSRDTLAARAQDCETIRHHRPNIIAVDFYATGDLIGTVDRLNGVTARGP